MLVSLYPSARDQNSQSSVERLGCHIYFGGGGAVSCPDHQGHAMNRTVSTDPLYNHLLTLHYRALIPPCRTLQRPPRSTKWIHPKLLHNIRLRHLIHGNTEWTTFRSPCKTSTASLPQLRTSCFIQIPAVSTNQGLWIERADSLVLWRLCAQTNLPLPLGHPPRIPWI